MQFLDFQTDGMLALLALVIYALLVLALVVTVTRSVSIVGELLPWAILWHMAVFSFYVFWMMPHYGSSDAGAYQQEAMTVAQLIRDGNWGSIDWGVSTKAVPILVGLIYTPLGGDAIGMCFLSTVFGFTGSLYCCRAFAFWVPPPQLRSYSLIVLFMPSIAVWTGSFGKDSLIALGLGLCTYGYSALMKSGRSRGLWHFLAGLGLTSVIRPHIALALVTAMAFSYLMGLAGVKRVSAPVKLLRLCAMGGLIVLLFGVTRGLLNIEEVSAGSLEEMSRSNGESNAAAGGSVVDVEIAPGAIGLITGLPRSFVRILFQPFPWEVNNAYSAFAATENLFIAWLVFSRLGRLRKLFAANSRAVYVLFCAFFTIALMFMFSFIPNLGLLSRERVQLLPALFAILIASEVSRSRQIKNGGQFKLQKSGSQLNPLQGANALARGGI